MRPEWVELDRTIEAGAEWFLKTRQPKKALISHHGMSNHVGGKLSVSFCPTSAHGAPKGTGVVVFDMATHEWSAFDEGSHGEDGPPIPPFTEEEIAEFKALLEKHGLTVRDQWNGAPFHTASFGIAKINGWLNSAAARYHEGCPEHGTVFCNGWQNPRGAEGCDWYGEHRALIVPPRWVAAEASGPATPEPRPEDHNLDAIRRALKKTKPVLEELGIHQSTVVAGRRGIIEGEMPRLWFDPIDGNGVCVPAEVFERIVALAEIGSQFEKEMG